MATLDMLYQSQFNWDTKKYSTLYFVLNKAVLNEQSYLSLLNPKLMTNTTKAMIKAHINHYQKHDLYEKFPNLSEIKHQVPLNSKLIVSGKIKLNTEEFRKMNIID